jgi:c-di-GMP-related signal transduction protein
MDKYNLSKMGIGVDFHPIVDAGLQIIAYEGVITLEENNPYQEDFEFAASEFYDVLRALDFYYKDLALKTYNGSLPLLFTTYPNVPVPYASALPIPEGFEVVVAVDPPKPVLDSMLVDLYEHLSENGVVLAFPHYGKGFLTQPLLQKLRPKFIILGEDVVNACFIDDETLKKISAQLETFKEMGIKILVRNIMTHEQFERLTSVADAFQGYWFSKMGGKPTIL